MIKNLFLILFGFLPLLLNSQSSIIFEQRIEFPEKNNFYALDQVLYMPGNVAGRQKLVDILYTKEPNQIKHDNGLCAVYDSKILKTAGQIVVSSHLELYRNDLHTARKRKNTIDPKLDMSEYLRPEARIQSKSKKIKNIAKKLVAETREQTVRNIFNFVVDTLSYDNTISDDRNAKLALKSGKGDCTEYTELMIALCRANKIPSRYVIGYVASDYYKKNPRHNWVEVYFNEYGWVTFDPTFADAYNAKTTFEKMLNEYIVISFTRDAKSGWDNNSESHKLKYSYRSVSQLDNALKKMKFSYQIRQLEKCEHLVDSMLNLGIIHHELFYYKAIFNLSKGKTDQAVNNLQGALKYAYFDNDKPPIYIRFAACFALLGNKDSAIKALQKAFENDYKVKTDDFRFMTQNNYFDSLKEEPFFIKTISKLKSRFYNRYSSLYEYEFIVNNWTKNINLDCAYKSGSFEFDGLHISHEQVLKTKLKSSEIIGRNYGEKFNFNSKGFLSSRTELRPMAKMTDSTWYTYDDLGRLKEKHFLKQNFEKDTLVSLAYYYDYTENCLSSIRKLEKRRKQFDTLLIFENHQDYVYVESFADELSRIRQANKSKLFFDDKGRRKKLITYTNNDSISIEWIYNDVQNNFEVWIGGYPSFYNETNKNNQIIKMKGNDVEWEYIYNKSGNLANEIIEGSGVSLTHKYKYNKKKLIKEKHTKMNNRNSKKEKYIYEYY